jgi:DNA invertase Pin-like site-specific DNA recombinase
MLVYSYIRFSSAKQAHGDSFQRQMESSRSFCERQGYSLSSENFQDLGVSGFKGDNWREGGLSLFLLAVKSGKVRKGSSLLVENLDRISRDEIDKALAVFCDILRSGIDIITLSPERTYTKTHLANPSTLIEAILGFVLANEESQKKSMRSKSVWVNKRKDLKPLGNTCPCWLSFNGLGYDLVPSKVELVRKIFDMAAGGQGLWAIVRYLTDNKIAPLSRRKNAKWNSVFISDLLRNRAVIGERVMKAGTNKGYFPSIIDEGLFLRVQSELTRRDRKALLRGRGSKKCNNLFPGMIVDVRDGGKMTFLASDLGGYLVASNSLRRTKNTAFVSFHYPSFEKWVLFAISGIKIADLEDGTNQMDIGDKEKELADIERNLSELQKHILAGKKASLYLSLIDQLEERKEKLTNEIESFKGITSCDHQESIDDICEVMDTIYDDDAPKGLRERLRGRLRTLLSGIRILFSGRNRTKRALVELVYTTGAIQRIAIDYDDGECTCKPAQFDLLNLGDLNRQNPLDTLAI